MCVLVQYLCVLMVYPGNSNIVELVLQSVDGAPNAAFVGQRKLVSLLSVCVGIGVPVAYRCLLTACPFLPQTLSLDVALSHSLPSLQPCYVLCSCQILCISCFFFKCVASIVSTLLLCCNIRSCPRGRRLWKNLLQCVASGLSKN